MDPVASNYMVKWPIHGSNFNTRDYNSLQMVLGDLEAIIEDTLRERLNINRQDYKALFSSVLGVICFLFYGLTGFLNYASYT